MLGHGGTVPTRTYDARAIGNSRRIVSREWQWDVPHARKFSRQSSSDGRSGTPGGEPWRLLELDDPGKTVESISKLPLARHYSPVRASTPASRGAWMI